MQQNCQGSLNGLQYLDLALESWLLMMRVVNTIVTLVWPNHLMTNGKYDRHVSENVVTRLLAACSWPIHHPPSIHPPHI